MSLTTDGLQILCDGEDCEARTKALVVLHPALSVGLSAMQPIDDWLFVAGGGKWRHYCPLCLVIYLGSLREHTHK